MDLNDRVFYVILGCVIGFFLGYFVRLIQDVGKIQKAMTLVGAEVHDMKEEVDEINIDMKDRRRRNEDGFMRVPLIADLLVVLVLSLTFWAAYTTGETNNHLEKAVSDIQAVQDTAAKQDKRIERISQCTLQFTSKTLTALNQRTTYSVDLAQANIEVLQAQADFLKIVLIIPPVSPTDSRAALQVYVTALDQFNNIAEKNKDKITTYEFPTNEELAQCLGVKLPAVETGEKQDK